MQTTVLSEAERRFLETARRAVMATVAPDDRPRLVPVCFVLGTDDPIGRPTIYTPLDEKPKRDVDPRKLARVQDLLVLPEVTLLADRWDENWSRLAWIRVYGTGQLLEPGVHEHAEHTGALALLRQKYEQYGAHDLESRPIIRIIATRALSWGDLS